MTDVKTPKESFEKKKKVETSQAQKRQTARQRMEDVRLSKRTRYLTLPCETVSQNVEKLHAEMFYKKKL